MGEPNMNPEKGVFGMARGRVKAPEAPALPVVTAPDRPKPPVKTKESRVMGFIKKHKVVTGVAASAAALAASYQIPAIHEAVDQQFLARIGLKTPEVNVPSTFDNDADVQTVKAGVNASPISTEKITSLHQGKEVVKPIIKNEGDFPIVPEITSLFPVKLKDQGLAEITTKYGKSFNNPRTGESMPQFLSYKEIKLFNAKDTEITAGMLYGIGTVKSIMVFRNPLNSSQENVPAIIPYLNNITIRFTTEEGPVYDVRMQSSDDDIRQLVPLDIVKNAPVLPRKQSSQGHPMEWTQEDSTRQGALVNPDTSLLKANYDNLRIWYSVTAIFPDKPIGQQFDSVADVRWSTDNNSKLHYPKK